MRRAVVALVAAFVLGSAGCGSAGPAASADDCRAYVEGELVRWRRNYPAYSKPENLAIEFEPASGGEPARGRASYESTVRGDVGAGRKMTVRYRFDVEHAADDAGWTCRTGAAKAVSMQVHPSDELTKEFEKERIAQPPISVTSIVGADPAGVQ